jgi:phosphopantothenoylcysteine decarboxylase/phosphopantothenate--cysteine ligase
MRGKRVLLGISGGIAAYKIAYLIRILKKQGAEVKCIMTPASSDFISPLVVSTLSGNPVAIEFWDRKTGVWTNHVELALWADLMVIAPLTANSLSSMANGACDNLLLATYLSMKGKTMVAPAMDLDMYAHPSTKRNLDQLAKDGVILIPAESGELASGLEGEGRMAEPETIAWHIHDFFVPKDLLGKKVLITAGPTYEAIDPVRFIGNHSSGKMGFALAEAAASRGADVTLITGPSSAKLTSKGIKRLDVMSASEMLEKVQEYWAESDMGIFAAAVADYRPSTIAPEKIKKKEESIQLELVKNPDILKWAGENKGNSQLLVGFALETTDLLKNGQSKLIGKHLNLIVMNTLQDEGAGFAGETNKVSILDDRNNLSSFELKSKSEVAGDILDTVMKYLC